MTKITFILSCIWNKIKKNFFKYEKNDISQECEKVLNPAMGLNSAEEFKRIEVYAAEYNVTTRWQTL